MIGNGLKSILALLTVGVVILTAKFVTDNERESVIQKQKPVSQRTLINGQELKRKKIERNPSAIKDAADDKPLSSKQLKKSSKAKDSKKLTNAKATQVFSNDKKRSLEIIEDHEKDRGDNKKIEDKKTTTLPGGFVGSGGPNKKDTSEANQKESGGEDSGPATSTQAPSIQGKVKPLVNAIALNGSGNFFDAYAAVTCVNPRIELFDVQTMTVLADNPLGDRALDQTTNFSFNPRALDVDLNNPNRYLLRTSGCSKNYERIITGFFTTQDISTTTSLLSKTIYAATAMAIYDVNESELASITTLLESQVSDNDDLDAIYAVLESVPSLATTFTNIFGESPSVLLDSAPDVKQLDIESVFYEESAGLLSVNTEHWSPSYIYGYEWYADNVLLSNNAATTYTALANSLRDVEIKVVVGHKNIGDDMVDRTKPYHELVYSRPVDDTVPTTAPLIALNAATNNPSNTLNIALDLSTGNFDGLVYPECKSFSSLAITETNTAPSPASFTYTCSSGPTQTETYTIQNTVDGLNTIYVWAIDANGDISAPSQVNIVTDRTNPLITFENIQANYRANSNATFEWVMSEANSSSTQTFTVDFYNGSSWANIANVNSLNGPLNDASFNTTYLLPNIGTPSAKLRVSFTDLAGNTSTQESSVFELQIPQLAISPTSHDYLNVLNKSLGTTQSFTVSNSGTASAINCSAASLSGANAVDFEIASDTCATNDLAISSSCSIGVRPKPQTKGVKTASLTWTCGLDSVTTNLSFTSTNNTPVAAATQSYTLNEDALYNFNLTAATDIDTDVLVYEVVSAPTNGTLSNCLASDGDLNCDYLGNLHYNGSDSFSYRAYDGSTYSAVTTVNLTINNVNDAPTVAATQSITTNEDTAINFNLNLGSDIDGDALTYIKTSDPAAGVLTCTGGASTACNYTPALNDNGSYTFTYKVNDALADSNTATVTINISAINDAPVMIGNQSLSTNEDTTGSITLSGASDIDLPAQTIQYQVVTAPTNGTLVNCIATGSWGTDLTCDYVPNANFNGSDSFTYKANDGIIDSAGISTVSITVNSINDAPTVPTTQSVATAEDTSVNFNLNLGSDVDGDTLTYIKVSDPSAGSLTCTGGTSSACTYTPVANDNGSYTFTYKVNDGSLDSNIATVTIIISSENDAPVMIADQSLTTNEDTSAAITLNGATDIDVPAQTLQYRLVSAPANGTLTNCITTGGWSTDRICDYVPNANFNGTDSFTYRANDGLVDSATFSTVTITINPVNDAPTLAATQSASTNEDTPLTFDLTAGSDIEADTLSYIKITNTTNGTITCVGGTSRSCTYTPNANFNGTDSFTYKVNDGALDSTSATVTITVNAINDAPTLASPQNISTNEDTAITFDLTAGSDIEGSALSYIKVTDTANGTITCVGGTSRSCTYTPNANFNGSDSFTYKVNDGALDSTVATVNITVTPVNDAPTLATPQNIATNEDTAITFDLNAGADIESDTLSYIKITNTSNGTITCVGGTSRSCTYTPNLNFNGSDSFTYKVNDGALDSTTATVNITVNSINDAPTLATPQNISTNEDTAITFDLTAGGDVEGDTLSYIKVTNTANGTITCVGGTSRSCTYTPNANFNGSDSFTYKVNDGLLDSTIATVNITVNPINDAPTLAATQSVSTNEDTVLNFSLTAGADIDGDTLQYVKLTNTANGTITCTGGTSRACTYTPNLNFNGTDSFTYNVSDGSLNSTTATVTITVNPVNDPPVMGANQTLATADNTAFNFTLSSATDVDLPAQTLSYKLVSGPTYGTLTNCISTGSYTTDITCTYTANVNYHGSDSFTYIANDGITDAVTTATVTFNVTDQTPPLAPTIILASNTYTNVTGATFTATSCSDTPQIFFNEGTQPAAGAAGWQACTTTAAALSYTLSAGEATKAVKAWAKDINGNVSTVATNFAITYDVTLPSIAVTTPSIQRGGGTLAVAFTVTELNTSASQTYNLKYFNGSAWVDIANPSSQNGPLSSTAFSYNWSVPSLNITTAKLRVTLTDLAGNTRVSESGAFEIDSIAPSIAISTPAANTYHQSSLTLTGTCETGATITFSGDMPSAFNQTCSAGSFSQLVNLSSGDGVKTITLTHTDPAGNISTTNRSFIRDEIPPSLALTSGANPGFTRFNTFTWGGTCEGNYTISVTGDETTSFACTSGTWSWTTAAKTVDGTYNYSLTQTDAAGNTSTALSVAWERDGTAPIFTAAAPVSIAANGSGSLTNNANSITLSGNCEGINPITVSGDATATFGCSSSSWLWTTPTVATDATRTYNFVQTDDAGNTTNLTFVWTRDTSGPALFVAQVTVKNNDDTVAYSGTCEDGLAINIAGSEASSATCTSGAWTWTSSAQTTDATRSFQISQTNALSNTTTVNTTWIRETNAPTISSLTTSAPANTKNAIIPISMQATTQNPDVYLHKICTRTDNDTKPLVTDLCWEEVNGATIGLPLAQTLNLNEQYYHTLGWSPGISYQVYAWVMDEAENISDLTNAGLGTIGTDTFTRIYDPGFAPTVYDAMAANVPSTPNPPTRTQTSVPAGTDVYIRWKATDNTALPAGAISLYYSEDEINFTQIGGAGSLDHGVNHGCTGYTLEANEGCFKWTGGSPLNTTYKIRVRVMDATDLSTQTISNALNSDIIKIIAGNTESGLGGSAITALFYTRANSVEADVGTLVVTKNGRVYFNDYKRGILTVDPDDGKQKIFIPMTGTSSGDGGPATDATLTYANKIALDYQNRLLIYDHNRIRRVDLNAATPNIQTIIGGGADISDTIANPLTAQLYVHSYNSWTARGMAFFPTPNGDIYFHSDYALKNNNVSTYRLRVYRSASNSIESLYFTGNGDSFDPAVDLSKCRLQNPGVRFDPSTSQLTGATLITTHNPNYPDCLSAGADERYARSYFDPATFQAIAPKDDSIRYYRYFHFTGMDGETYVYADRSYINRVNYDGTYTRVLGSGTRGLCADGTPATSCNMSLQDVFISSSGRFYFTDNGMIRSLDDNGNVVTLYGQSSSYGDNINALNSRFSLVNTVAQLDNGKIIVDDTNGYYLKEFSREGNINIIAGNGNYTVQNLTTDAKAQGMYTASWWVADKSDGRVFIRRTHDLLAVLNRTTSLWEQAVGGSTPSYEYWDGDGQLGAYSRTGRHLLPVGYDQTNKKLLLNRMKYNSVDLHYEDFMLKIHDVTDGYRQSHLAGTNDVTETFNGGSWSMCATPALAATCKVLYYSGWYMNTFWDQANGRWILAATEGMERRVYSMVPGGNVEQISYLARNIDNGAIHINQAGVDYLYYCTGGRIYKHNLDSDTDLGVMPWPVTNMSCRGMTLDYDPTNNSIIFPFEQNGLMGVAEYFL